MNSNSKRREDYHKKRSSLNLHRNLALAAPSKVFKGSVCARIVGILLVLCVSFGLAWVAHMYFALHLSLIHI